MIKSIRFVIFLLLLSLQTVVAQEIEIPKMKEIKGDILTDSIHPLQHKKGLWGYADREDKFVIKPVFERVCPYEGSVARVCADGHWGFIGSNGLYIVEPRYETLSEFSADSIAIAKHQNQYILVHSRGHLANDNGYASIEKTEKGYIVQKDNLYGILKCDGTSFLPLQFKLIEELDRRHGIYIFVKDGIWGVLKDGVGILSHHWRSYPTLIRDGDDKIPNFYKVERQGKIGIAASDGRYLTPSIFDDIYLDDSNNYYVTVKDGLYGALSLTFNVIAPPIYPNPPVVTEDILRVYDGHDCYAANIKGATAIQHCAGLYEMLRPDDYRTTTEIPEWMKSSIISDNIAERETQVYIARGACELLVQNNYNTAAVNIDDVVLSIPADNSERNGVCRGVAFERTSGEVTHLTVAYKTLYSSTDGRVCLVADEVGEEYYFIANNNICSLRDMLVKYSVKQHKSLYPKDVVYTPSGDIVVRITFIRDKAQLDTPLVESDETKLPVSISKINVYNGEMVVAGSEAVVVLDGKTSQPRYFAQLLTSDSKAMIASKFGGFYTTSATDMLVTPQHSLVKYDDRGQLKWTFRVANGENIYDIEETDNFIYLCGSVEVDGSKKPLLVQLSKFGDRCNSWSSGDAGTYNSGVKREGYLLYTKLMSCNDQTESSFYPRYVLEDINDDVGVKLHCVWEDWGGATIGGCGLMSEDGKWLQAPVSSSDDSCTAYYWEFKDFYNDILIVCHLGKYGVIDRNANMLIEPKYDKIEYMSNPKYVKVIKGRYQGVMKIDGRIIVPIQYEHIGDMIEDHIVVGSGWLYGCYDKEGNMIAKLDYRDFGDFSEGLAVIGQLGQFGYINTKGEVVIPPFAEQAYSFKNGLAKVVVNGLTGYIDTNGAWVIDPQYEDGGNYSCGIIAVRRDGKYFYVDMENRAVSTLQYAVAEDCDNTCQLARVSNNDKWGVVDRSGKVVVPIDYDAIEFLSDGYIQVTRNDKYGIYDMRGKMLFNVEYDWIQLTNKGALYNRGIATMSRDTELIRVDIQGNRVYNYQVFVKKD